MASIKRFFEKKKLDIKFKKAGEGHCFDESPKSASSSVGAAKSAARAVPVHSAQRAGEAALVRMSQPSPQPAVCHSRSVKNQVRDEMKAEKEAMLAAQTCSSGPQEVHRDTAPVLGVRGIYYRCSMVGPEVLPKPEMEVRIHEYLLQQLGEVPEMASALMIHTLNKDKHSVRTCVETLCKYLDNIVAKPEEEKFRKIRILNKAFQDRVGKLEGSDEFLQSIGFDQKMLPFEDSEQVFYSMSEEKARNSEQLLAAKAILLAGEAIRPELDRGLCVLDASNPALHIDTMQLPDDFFRIGKEELKREMEIRREAVDKLGMLRTKAMRERDEQRDLRKYRFTLVRVRFPDNTVLQGTFSAVEKFSAVISYVRSALLDDWMPFILVSPSGHRLTTDDENDQTLAELGLCPAAIITFAWDEDIQKEVALAKGATNTSYLKEDLMMLKQ